MVVDQQHLPVVVCCVRRLKLNLYAAGGEKHPYELGGNAYCESVHDDEAVELATRLFRHAQFFGVATVNFKRGTTDNRLKLIKIDLQFVGATALATALGLDMPKALYETFALPDQTTPRPRSYRDGVGWIWLEAYLHSLWRNRKDRPVRKELLDLLKTFPRLRTFAYFDLRDPLPCVLLFLTAYHRLGILENRAVGEDVDRPVSG